MTQSMEHLLASSPAILMEFAVIERLRRSPGAPLHPTLVNAPLIYDDAGRKALGNIHREYIEIAREAGLPLLLCTPTWRANAERVAAAAAPETINADAMAFMQDIRAEFGPDGGTIKIGGLVGCKNDCYLPGEGLTAEAAEAFHAWQCGRLAGAGADFLIAVTLPNVDEALGLARSMSATGLPYFVSFVVGRDGRILDGTPLNDAIKRIDADSPRQPLAYMAGCSHPTFLCAATQPPALFDRLTGIQANASSLDHCELEGADQLQANGLETWLNEMMNLHATHGMKILGGCCGTDGVYMRRLTERLSKKSQI